jgi:hypothetical protein
MRGEEQQARTTSCSEKDMKRQLDPLDNRSKKKRNTSMSGISDLGPLVVAAAGAVRDQEVVADQMKQIERLTKKQKSLPVFMQNFGVTVTGPDHNPVYAFASKDFTNGFAGIDEDEGLALHEHTPCGFAQLPSLQINFAGNTCLLSQCSSTEMAGDSDNVNVRYEFVSIVPGVTCALELKYDAPIPSLRSIGCVTFYGFQANPFRLRDDEIPSITFTTFEIRPDLY